MMQEDKEQVSFQYANECDLEIHCSPFGLSGLYIKVRGTNIMGIGSTMGLVTGSTKGYIHYNDCQDLIDQKYKLYVVVDEDDMLRIDFTKISPLNKASDDLETKLSQVNQSAEAPREPKQEGGDDFIGRSPNSINTTDNSSYSSSLKSPQNATDKSEARNEGDGAEDDDVPTLIFKGKCPDGRPDNIEPFIGIFSFERED